MPTGLPWVFYFVGIPAIITWLLGSELGIRRVYWWAVLFACVLWWNWNAWQEPNRHRPVPFLLPPISQQ
jgi:hypothetical protein